MAQIIPAKDWPFMKQLVLILALVVGAIALSGCGDSLEDYKASVRDGIKTLPCVQDMVKMFPNEPTDHFITQYGFDKSKSVLWNTEIYFGGGYDLTYQVPVKVDYKLHKVLAATGPGTFYLEHTRKISGKYPQIEADYNPGNIFNEADWKKVVAAHGDFHVIGITINTNSPTPRFDEYVRACRSDRVQVDGLEEKK